MLDMDLPSILLIGIGVSLDCLAVAIAGSISMPGITPRQWLRASISFGLFQTAMLTIGWLAGRTIVEIVETYDHWVAFVLLVLVGGNMIREAFESEDKGRRGSDITKGLGLLALSVATSIDSLAVGLSLGFLETGVLVAALAVGVITFAISGAGFYFGSKIGRAAGRWAEILGGIVLIGIGLRIILTHLL